MVFKCVVFVALVAVANAGVISSPIGLGPQISLGGLSIARAGLVNQLGVGINQIGLASPLVSHQVVGPSAISSQQVLRSQIVPQQLIAQQLVSPVLRSQVIAAPQQYIAAPQQYIAAPQQYIAAPQQLIAPQLLRSQVLAAPQQLIAPQLLRSQVIAAPQQLIAAPQQLIAAPQLLRSQVIAAPQLIAPVTKTVVAQAEYDPNPQYSFAYDVQDALTGDSKNQQETRNGDVVQGSYSLTDPDGTRRTVDYVADPINGFNAVVRKEPLGVAVKTIAAGQVVAASPLGLSSQILG